MRDHLLGNESSDHDFATDATPEEVIALFNHVIPTGILHGTVTVIFRGEHFEVTTFRTESGYADNRHPDSIEFVSDLSEDLSRRDFTINALAVDTRDGSIIDEHAGLDDLKNRILRAIGSPVLRFTEDSLRILRGYRFSTVLEFTFDTATRQAAKSLGYTISNISVERIRDELNKMLSANRPSIGLVAMKEDGFLKYILPELTMGFDIAQKGIHKFDVCMHNIYSCDGAPKENLIVRWAALLHDVGKPESLSIDDNGLPTFYHHERISASLADTILQRLKFPNNERNRINHLITHHMFHYTPEWTDAAIRRFISKVGIDYLDDLFLLRFADSYGASGKPSNDRLLLEFIERINTILEEESALSIRDLAITGKDLISSGIPQGPFIGHILKELLETVLDDPSNNTKERLIIISKRLYEKLS